MILQNDIRILLAEDDHNLGLLLNEYLSLKGYEVSLCTDGEEAWKTYNKGTFDVAILDVMMPKLDGFALAKLIRQHSTDIPLLFLTARNSKEDRIEGLKIGADDYIAKPFAMEELELRLEAIMRRTYARISSDKTQYQLNDFSFDFNNQELATPQESFKLTTKEAALLKMLCDHSNDVLPRELALKAIWKEDNYFTARSMDVYITKLRKYLKSDDRIEIKNVHGRGYKLLINS
ncbi:MAG: response regulator transcription factor [Chitinophagales bacterium]|nr:response regulator transcription factor [Bacteroidota bacterium]